MEFFHEMGIERKELVKEFERILSRIGFSIIHSDANTIIATNEKGDIVKIHFKERKSGLLSLPRTDVRIECSEDVHKLIQTRIIMLRGGG